MAEAQPVALEDALEPCLSCGSPGKMIHSLGNWSRDGYGPDGSRIVCTAPAHHCCMMTPAFYGPDQDRLVIAAWSRRTLPQPATDPQQASEVVEPLTEEQVLAELALLYNYDVGSDEQQFTRWQMVTAIHHGHRLARAAIAAIAALTPAPLAQAGQSRRFMTEAERAEIAQIEADAKARSEAAWREMIAPTPKERHQWRGGGVKCYEDGYDGLICRKCGLPDLPETGEVCVPRNVERPAPSAVEAERDALRDLVDALVAQLDHVGCTCTFQSNDCCAYAKAQTLAATEPRHEQ